jgi:DNA-binding NarL/FixJ family response regulator
MEWTELTQKERRIAQLLAQGMTNGEIARELTLNSIAVDFHVQRLLEKTGLKSRSDLTTWVAAHAPDRPELRARWWIPRRLSERLRRR